MKEFCYLGYETIYLNETSSSCNLTIDALEELTLKQASLTSAAAVSLIFKTTSDVTSTVS